jgi:hypothetical protein
MNCPSELTEVLMKLLMTGHLLIRMHGLSGRADLCAIEADHLHNLPDLVWDYSGARLYYYWAMERPSFAGRARADELRDSWEPLWEQLRPYAESLRAPADTN